VRDWIGSIDQEAGVLVAMEGPPGGGSEAAGASIGDLGASSLRRELKE
jgi:hypothetical protein